MRKYILCFVFFSITFFSCIHQQPSPVCQHSGAFVMTLNNQKGEITYHPELEDFVINFSPDGSLNYSAIGLPCSLDIELMNENTEVIFSAEVFELSDGIKTEADLFSLYIKEIVVIKKTALNPVLFLKTIQP